MLTQGAGRIGSLLAVPACLEALPSSCLHKAAFVAMAGKVMVVVVVVVVVVVAVVAALLAVVVVVLLLVLPPLLSCCRFKM
eukprot:COSAG01_NODE_12847_length_1676_cov_1.476221_4_plen_80_part_01